MHLALLQLTIHKAHTRQAAAAGLAQLDKTDNQHHNQALAAQA
jgi:hypothetical protein